MDINDRQIGTVVTYISPVHPHHRANHYQTVWFFTPIILALSHFIPLSLLVQITAPWSIINNQFQWISPPIPSPPISSINPTFYSTTHFKLNPFLLQLGILYVISQPSVIQGFHPIPSTRPSSTLPGCQSRLFGSPTLPDQHPLISKQTSHWLDTVLKGIYRIDIS